MARRGRKPKSQEQKLRDALERSKPPEHIQRKREQFAFFKPTPKPGQGRSERDGEIDQDVCDGIGMFHALGLLDGHPVDGLELRNIGREWRDFYCSMLRRQGFKAGGYERMDRSVAKEPRVSERLDRMDLALRGFERSVLLSLLVDPIVGSWPLGEEMAPWVRAHIAMGLLERGRIPPGVTRFPDCEDDAKLAAAIRGLFALYDASLPGRYERRAA
jgi:hypothetical protein